jgi:2,6-dihydroxypseudooxynicotine hydrolase
LADIALHRVTPGPDDRVVAALAHWGPRFTTNGVAVADFTAIAGGLTAWDDWCSAWSAGAAVHEQLGRTALADGRTRSAGAHLSQAAVYYHFAKFLFVEDLQQMRAAHQSAVRCLDDAMPYLDPPGERVEIPFEGSHLVGILRRPHSLASAPVVVLVAGLDSTKEEFRSTEALFLERGLATFSVDGPGQGEAEYDLPIRGDWEVPGRAIIDYLEGDSGLDAERIGVWGVSMGGYYAPRWASGDDRVRACIALSGPLDFGECLAGAPELTRTAFRVRAKVATSEQAQVRADELNLVGRTELIRCPLLVVFGQQDRLIPWTQGQRLASETGAETLMLPDGNHGCMNVAAKHRYRSADWMAARLGATAPFA